MDQVTIGQLLTEIVEYGASDLHLSNGNPPIMRLKGKLVRMKGYDVLTPDGIERLIVNVIPGTAHKKIQEEKEVDFAYSLKDMARFRVNVFYEQGNSYGAVFRTIPSRPYTLEELGVPPVMRDLALKNQGLILLTGPTGCGKTTTLAAIIDFMNNTRNSHIITIEDPIEYTFRSRSCLIRQRELGSHTNSFSQALRACLRQDPDIILLGEMRDNASISTALRAAETGHVVLSTLHTNNAVDAINRILDMFEAEGQGQIRSQLAATLEGVFAQRLIPDQTQKGLAGNAQVMACEVLVVTPAVRNLIRENKVYMIRHAIETGTEYRMQTMESSLKQLYEDERISFETAVRNAFDPDSFRQLCGEKITRKAGSPQLTGKTIETMAMKPNQKK